MGSFLQTIAGAATGFLTGGPIGAAIGGAAGALGGSGNPITATGNLTNTGSSLWQSGMLASQDLINQQNALYQLQVQQQASQFNNMLDEKSELMREGNELRNVSMAQKKADTEITKKFIESIN